MLSTPFQKIHQTYTRTALWMQICEKTGLSFLSVPAQLEEDRLAISGSYREFEYNLMIIDNLDFADIKYYLLLQVGLHIAKPACRQVELQNDERSVATDDHSSNAFCQQKI